MFLLSGLGSLLGIGGGAGAAAGAAAGTAAAGTAAAGTAAAAGTGISLSSILQGVATVGGIVATIASGQAEAERLELAALDAEAEKPLENLQGIDRRRSLKAAAVEAIGELETAYAGSGVDLSFGTAAQAKTDALRELDLGLTSDTGTTMTRLSRLAERAANYRTMAKRTRQMAGLQAFTQGLGLFSSLAQRG